MLEIGINIAKHSIAQHDETTDHCLTAYQHHVDYGRAYLISPQRNKRCQVTEIVFPFFRFAEVAFLEERSDPLPPPSTGHAYFVNFNKCFYQNVRNKCSFKATMFKNTSMFGINYFSFYGYIRVGTPPIPSPCVGH